MRGVETTRVGSPHFLAKRTGGHLFAGPPVRGATCAWAPVVARAGRGGAGRGGVRLDLGAAAAAAAPRLPPAPRANPKGTPEPATQPHVAHGGSLSPRAPARARACPMRTSLDPPSAHRKRGGPGQIVRGGGAGWAGRRLGVSASRRPGTPPRGRRDLPGGFSTLSTSCVSPRAQRRRRGGAGARGRGGAGARGRGERGTGRGARGASADKLCPPRAAGCPDPGTGGPSISTWVRRAWPRAHVMPLIPGHLAHGAGAGTGAKAWAKAWPKVCRM